MSILPQWVWCGCPASNFGPEEVDSDGIKVARSEPVDLPATVPPHRGRNLEVQQEEADTTWANDTDCPKALNLNPGMPASELSEQEHTEDEKTDSTPAIVCDLARVEVFMEVPSEDLKRVAEACVWKSFDAGQTIVKQGDPADTFYLIRTGTAVVRVKDVANPTFAEAEATSGGDAENDHSLCDSAMDGASSIANSRRPSIEEARSPTGEAAVTHVSSQKKSACEGPGSGDGDLGSGKVCTHPAGNVVARLRPGDCIGAHGLLRVETSLSTILAGANLTCLTITRDKFAELDLGDCLQIVRQSRFAVGCASRGRPSVAPTPKTEAETQLIIKALRKNGNLNKMVKLKDAQLQKMAAGAWKEFVPKEETLIKAGDLEADFFYIVQSGHFGIYLPAPSMVRSVSAEKAAKQGGCTEPVNFQAHAGDSFGEIALLYQTPRSATVEALEDSVVWVLGREIFKTIMMQSTEERTSQYAGYLQRIKIFENLSEEDRHMVAGSMREMVFRKGDIILKQGSMGDTLYLLYNGTVAVYKDRKLATRLRATDSKKTAEIFGERALLDNEPRTATVKVISETANVMSIDRGTFEILLGPLSELRESDSKKRKNEVQASVEAFAQQRWKEERKARQPILKKDLKRIGRLGSGGFAAVDLVEHKETHEWYALKIMSKGYIVKTGFEEGIMHEKNILMIIDSPFFIKFYESYNYSQHLYFLLEVAPGGDLFSWYNRRGLHGSDKHCKYYVASMAFALQHLHSKKIIHRDVKPENILFSQEGRVKLTDFDNAKFTVTQTYTTCGTPEYFAPEVIQSTGHHAAVDWWGLGILSYELMVGETPFCGTSPMHTCSNVVKGIGAVAMPSAVRGPVCALIRGLLAANPSERLPMRPGGIKTIKELQFFQNFDWKGTEKQTSEPPVKPKQKKKEDFPMTTSGAVPPEIAYTTKNSKWDKNFATST